MEIFVSIFQSSSEKYEHRFDKFLPEKNSGKRIRQLRITCKLLRRINERESFCDFDNCKSWQKQSWMLIDGKFVKKKQIIFSEVNL